MAQLRGCHRWSFQVTAEVFHAAPGTPGLFGEVDFPGAAILGMQVTAPPVLIKDMAKARQVTGVDVRIVVTQQVNDGVAPDLLYLFLFKEQLSPDVVFDVEAAAGDGDVNMRVLIELPAIGVEGTKDADLDTLPAGPATHGTGGTAKQVVEQGPVVVEKRPQQVGHGKRDVLPVAVGQDVLLLGNPLLGGLEAATATGLGLAALAEEARVCAVRRGTAITVNAHEASTAGEHALDGEFGPVAEGIAMFIQILAPAVVMLEQQLCGSRNVHCAEYRGWQVMGKGPRRQRAQVAGVLIYADISAGAIRRHRR